MRQLSKLRGMLEDLIFETKIRSKNGRKRWGVIVAERSKLLYDRRSLFYDHEGRHLHNYTTLGKGGAKIPPAKCFVRARGTKEAGERLEKRVCDIRFNRKDSIGIQPFKSYGALRDVGNFDRNERAGRRGDGLARLRARAFALACVLAEEHWDNCKVAFSARTAFCYAFGALRDGHDVRKIASSYSRALFVCHGLATDMGCRDGRVVFFNLSSTVIRARQMLEADGLSPSARVARWYESRANPTPNRQGREAVIFPSDPAELRRRIAESLGCSLSPQEEAASFHGGGFSP